MGSSRNRRRWPARILIYGLLGVLCNPSTAGTDMNDSTKKEIRARLERAAEAGRLDGLEIEYWIGGGAPPPHYRSDQLRLLTRDGRDVFEFARPLWDASFDPPDLIEKLSAEAKTADVQQVARLILESSLLDEPTETGPTGGFDLLTTEIAIAAGSRRFERKHRGNQVPGNLVALSREVHALCAALETSGERAVFQRGERLSAPPPRR
jgi:hypothetical protein